MINPKQLAAAYEFFRTYPPFKDLPESDEIEFNVTRHRDRDGHYERIKGQHIIAVSASCVTTPFHMMEVIAHEMLHLKQALEKTETKCDHNQVFIKLAKQVAIRFGWDVKDFISNYGEGSC